LVVGIFMARGEPKQNDQTNNAETHLPQKTHRNGLFSLAFARFSGEIAHGTPRTHSSGIAGMEYCCSRILRVSFYIIGSQEKKNVPERKEKFRRQSRCG
jgi:hypothetical protein